MITEVRLSDDAVKQLRKLPPQIRRKLAAWALLVETVGLDATRKIPGYHDESLHGTRTGQRSIRLNRGYRAIYRIMGNVIQFVQIEEVGNHDIY